jgi:DNA-binding transcriptional regulator YiaG
MKQARDEIHQRLVEQIKLARLEMNMTQVEFAKMLRVSAGTVQNWERGASFPRAKQRRRLARLFADLDDEKAAP